MTVINLTQTMPGSLASHFYGQDQGVIKEVNMKIGVD